MFRKEKKVWAGMLFTVLTIGVLGSGWMPSAFAVSPDQEKSAVLQQQDVKKVQETLRDKGYYSAEIDGMIGPKTRAGIRQYQK
ncbi:MAG: hypothetical protein EHM18_16985, partial [Acidobacteria bacterium]